MDVATFMATVSPIAAVAVLPLAIANGDVFGMSATGWKYMLVLTFVSGVAAQGLMVFAQKSIAIGTIGIAQVVQPVLAVVWSFLLLGESVNHNQVVGIAIVLSGLLAFLVLNERGYRIHRRLEVEAQTGAIEGSGTESVPDGSGSSPSRGSAELSDEAGVGPVPFGDEVRGGVHALVGRVAEVPSVARSPASAAMRPRASSANTSTWASPLLRASSRIVCESLPGSRIRVTGVHGGEQAFAECGLLATSSVAVPRVRRSELPPGSFVLAEGAQDASEVDPGQCRHAHVAGGFSLVDRQLEGGSARRRSRPAWQCARPRLAVW